MQSLEAVYRGWRNASPTILEELQPKATWAFAVRCVNYAGCAEVRQFFVRHYKDNFVIHGEVDAGRQTQISLQARIDAVAGTLIQRRTEQRCNPHLYLLVSPRAEWNEPCCRHFFDDLSLVEVIRKNLSPQVLHCDIVLVWQDNGAIAMDRVVMVRALKAVRDLQRQYFAADALPPLKLTAAAFA